MNTKTLFNEINNAKPLRFSFICLLIFFICGAVGYFFQKDFGRITIEKLSFQNYNSIVITAKLFKPHSISTSTRYPGILYVHGYQSCRETNDPYCIELARRGFVVLSIDAIGRGNSGVDLHDKESDFDTTYGAKTAFALLKSLPQVDSQSLGIMGHSLGASIAYSIAMQNNSVKSLVITGNAYKDNVTNDLPPNMLMIYGKWDEFRGRMTGTKNFYKEWMGTDRTKLAIADAEPQYEVTYGDFTSGTARRVYTPPVIHILESHSHGAVAESVLWMKKSLNPPDYMWINENQQVWHIKEWCSLIAMCASFLFLFPFSIVLLRTGLFKSLQNSQHRSYSYTCSPKDFPRFFTLNCILVWLYIPSILMIFAFHKYVIRIDFVFPLMVVNAIVWWFLLSNTIGFLLFKMWFHKKKDSVTLFDLGISFQQKRFQLDWSYCGKAVLFAGILFICLYLLEFALEAFFFMDFRFIFSFANDLTPYRALLFFQYMPLLLLGFLFNGIFLHGQLRHQKRINWYSSFLSNAIMNCAVMIIPLVLLLLVQYIPLFVSGYVPLTGPGDMLVLFVQNIFHIIVVLCLVIPLSTWFYQITGKIYLGAFLNACIVSWMFTSTQVIAPIPV